VGKTAKPGVCTSFIVFSVTVARVMLLYTTEWVTLPAGGGSRRGGEGVSGPAVGKQGEGMAEWQGSGSGAVGAVSGGYRQHATGFDHYRAA
jgi:hypothetical protein